VINVGGGGGGGGSSYAGTNDIDKLEGLAREEIQKEIRPSRRRVFVSFRPEQISSSPLQAPLITEMTFSRRGIPPYMTYIKKMLQKLIFLL
jgi:hypothetical protein